MRSTVAATLLGLSFAQTKPKFDPNNFDVNNCGATGWFCFCEEETEVLCDGATEKAPVFTCLLAELEAGNDSLSPECIDSINKRISASAAAVEKAHALDDGCSITGWRCKCGTELKASCSDVDTTDANAQWNCLTTTGLQAGLGPDCRSSLEERLVLEEQARLKQEIVLPSGTVATFLKSAISPLWMRLRSVELNMCLHDKTNSSDFTPCEDSDYGQLVSLQMNGTMYQLMKGDLNSNSICFSSQNKWASCLEDDANLHFQRNSDNNLMIKAYGKCLTVTKPQVKSTVATVSFAPCVTASALAKKGKAKCKKGAVQGPQVSQSFVLEPVLGVEIDTNVPVQANQLADALSDAMVAAVYPMLLRQKKNYDLQVEAIQLLVTQQMNDKLKAAGIALEAVNASATAPKAPPGPPGPPPPPPKTHL